MLYNPLRFLRQQVSVQASKVNHLVSPGYTFMPLTSYPESFYPESLSCFREQLLTPVKEKDQGPWDCTRYDGYCRESRSQHCQWMLVTQWSVKIGLVLALIVDSGGCGGFITDKASCCVTLLPALLSDVALGQSPSAGRCERRCRDSANCG